MILLTGGVSASHSRAIDFIGNEKKDHQRALYGLRLGASSHEETHKLVGVTTEHNVYCGI